MPGVCLLKKGWQRIIPDGMTFCHLLRFQTSKSHGELVSLEQYVERMAEDQTDMYYILGDNLESVERSPHLDYFKAHDLEVLMMVDPLDAFMIQNLREYDGKA